MQFKTAVVAIALMVCSATVLTVTPVHAQGLVSAGAGLGTGIGDHNKDTGGNGSHGAVYVQFHPPIIPVAIRADALFSKTANSGTSTSLMADVVYLAPIPVVVPYAILGYGQYGIGKDGSQSGWNGGVGARVRTPVIAFYMEARRHQRIGRDLLTIGISR